MKIIFLGTPEFAVAPLKALASSRHEVVAVVSQPDRAKDRKGRLLPTPVRAYAEEIGIPVYQFEKIRADGIDVLKRLRPDIMVTAAYGQILSREILEIAPYGVINVHASFLPKLRGSAPVQWAIINGDRDTGITIMQTDVGVDSGDILAVRCVSIAKDETSGELLARLSCIGAELLLNTLDKIEDGTVNAEPQDESKATRCRMLTKADGHLDFCETKEKIVCRCLGVTPSPGAFAYLGGETIKIGRVSAVDGDFGECGTVKTLDGKIIVACADGGIAIEKLQLPGAKMLSAREFLNGRSLKDGARLS